MEDSILTSVKKVLGLTKDYTVFDLDIIIHINSVFAILNQLGIGPAEGFVIEDDAPTWSEYLGDNANLNLVKSYVYLRVRMLFDPPGTPYHINSLEAQAKEMEWRMNVYREAETWPSQVV